MMNIMRMVTVEDKGERTYAIRVRETLVPVKVFKEKMDGKLGYSASIDYDSEKLTIHLATQGNSMKHLRAMITEALELCLEENDERLAIARQKRPVPARR